MNTHLNVALESGRSVTLDAARLRVLVKLSMWGTPVGDLALTPSQARRVALALNELADRAEGLAL